MEEEDSTEVEDLTEVEEEEEEEDLEEAEVVDLDAVVAEVVSTDKTTALQNMLSVRSSSHGRVTLKRCFFMVQSEELMHQ